MKFNCEKSELQTSCQIAARAVAAKSPIPALEGLLLTAKRGKLKITGYDLRKGIYTSVDADIIEDGEIVVNSRLFCEMLRRLPDGTVSLSCDSGLNLQVKCGRSQFNISGIEATDYPELPGVEGQESFQLSQKALRSMIGQTIFAVSDNDARPIYTGSLFDVDGDTLTMVSVDGFRLAKRTEKIENGLSVSGSFVVPGYSLTDVEKMCGDDEEKVTVSVGQKHISFKAGETVLVSRRLEGDFLNYKKSIPETSKYYLTVNKSDFISTIDRVSLIISEKNTSPVRMKIEDGKIYCACVTPIGKAEDTCMCEGNADGLEIGFNDRYFLDALKASDTDKLKIGVSSPSSPCIMEAAEGDSDFTFMILPVRLRSGEA